MAALLSAMVRLACRWQFPRFIILPDLPHDLVRIDAAAVVLRCGHTAVLGREVQRELPLRRAQRLRHLSHLFQLLCRRLHAGRKVDSRQLCHHTDISVCKEPVQRIRSLNNFCRPKHIHDLPVVGVAGLAVLCKVQHSPIWQDVPGPLEGVRRAELFHGQLAAVFRTAARFLCLGIIGILLVFPDSLSPRFQLGIRLPQLVIHRADPVFQFGSTLVELFPLFQIALVFCTFPVCSRLRRENSQCLLFFLNGLHFLAVHPAVPLVLQLPALICQSIGFFLQCVHFHRSTQLEPDVFLHSFAVSLAFGGILCYTLHRRYFLSSRKGAPHIHREMCGNIFFFC